MTESSDGQVINRSALPRDFPTHLHDASFWESLGRAIATFGFLEEVLGKAIFAFTAIKPYPEEAIAKAFEEWVPKLQRSLSDPLQGLIDSYGKAVRDHPDATIKNLDDLLSDLKEAAIRRNILCHGSWRAPDPSGGSLPFFVNRQGLKFDTVLTKESMDQIREYTIELICSVIDTVSHMGWQFPGTSGSGKELWPKKS